MGTRFHLQRDRDVSGVSGTGLVAHGRVLPGGAVVLEWLGEWPTIVFHSRGIESVEAIHGHDGATRIVWDDGATAGGDRPEPVDWERPGTLGFP
jgi:hypothetical protein